MRRLRYWLIRRLAGNDLIIGNATLGPEMAADYTFLTLSNQRGLMFGTRMGLD